MNNLDTFNIVKGIPVLKSREERFPFHELAVGDAFTFQLHYIAEIRSASQWVAKKRGMKFSVRKDKTIGLGVCQRIA